MTREEVRRRAEAVFAHLERTSLLFEETGWMNSEDREAVIGPIADAIFDACGTGLSALPHDPSGSGTISCGQGGFWTNQG